MANFPKGWQTSGHDGASRLLLNTFRAGRLAHAYLITGPEQSGRRTLALDLARAVNCTGRAQVALGSAAGAGGPDVSDRPCGDCAQCSRITRGLHADVRVIAPDTPIESDRFDPEAGADKARHKDIRIGHIHDLAHQAYLKPFEGTRRVFIVDGAELMNSNTANALLKTLEEPPQDVLIVLVARSASAVPATIVSRCHRVDLRPVPPSDIESLLARHSAAPAQAALLAKLAAGRPGWAVNALTDPSRLEKHTQAVQRVTEAVTGGLEERFRYARVLGDTFWRKREEALEEMDVWLGWWRDLAAAKLALRGAVTNADRLPELEAIGSMLDIDSIVRAAEVVARTKRTLEANANARLALEVMMLDLPWVDLTSLPPMQTAIASA